MVQTLSTNSQGEPRGAKGSAPLAPLGGKADAFSPNMGGNLPPFGQKQHHGSENLAQGEALCFLEPPLGIASKNNPKGSQREKMDFDDRVECKHCAFFKQEMATQRFPADVWDKIVRVNHPANQWMFELAKVKDGWVTVTHQRSACYGGEPAPMPTGLKHRCDYFKPFNEVAIENATKEWWEQ
jgi:hypothetical protein